MQCEKMEMELESLDCELLMTSFSPPGLLLDLNCLLKKNIKLAYFCRKESRRAKAPSVLQRKGTTLQVKVNLLKC
jgi:hypothetical protein